MSTVTPCAPGVAASEYAPGDFILTTNNGLVARAIRFGERLRVPACWCWCNHAALLVNAQGTLIEALASGLTQSHIDKYTARQYVLVRPDLNDAQRAHVVRWAQTRYQRHEQYGWTTIACETLVCLTGTKLRFGVSGECICSGFVSSALAEGGLDMGDDPAWVQPAQLAEWFKASAP